MLIDDFMYQGDLIGELNKDASVIVFTYTKMPAAKVHTSWDAWSKVDNNVREEWLQYYSL